MSLFGSQAPPSRTWTVLHPVQPELLQRMLLYEGKSAFYLLGYYGDETRCRLLTFPKSKTAAPKSALEVTEDAKTYSPAEAEAHLQHLHAEPNDENLQLRCEAYGILGCFHLLEGYYLHLITKRKALGSLAGHTVYGIAETALIPLSGMHDSWAERRYRKLLLSGVDLTKDFFFSYTYNIYGTVQHNLMHREDANAFDCIFVWNEYLTRDLRTALMDNKWVLPLVHGSWQQRNLSIFGKVVQLTLISRRSRRFAGTRYLKRGINQFGFVANEVETEQIVSLQNLSQPGVPSLASVTQIRGSIPLFWGQATSALNPRPRIKLYNTDPLYDATRKHFDDLFERYGGPLVVLNLIRSHERHPRETILRREFGRAISFLNQHYFQDDIIHIPWDFKAYMRKDGRQSMKETGPMMKSCVDLTGFCAINPNSARSSKDIETQLQQGVLRTNCIDCLDRTNITQYLYGITALGFQLCSLGLLSTNEIDPDCSLAYELMQMYEVMGNDLSLQYGGSEAHGTFFERMRGDSEAATQSRELVRSIKRYYSNAVSDPEKQDAINLFLGHFVPTHDKADVWELESDFLLHCGVDWEKQRASFALCPSRTLSTRLSTHSTTDAQSSRLSRKASAIEFYEVPVISQAGDPEAPPSGEQSVKKDVVQPQSSWNLTSWFRSYKEPTPFRLPEARGPVLHSLEEMLSLHPVVEVRLHDGASRRQKDGLRIAFQKSLARLQKQESMTDLGSCPVQLMGAGGRLSPADSGFGFQSRSSSANNNEADSAVQHLRSRTHERFGMAMSDPSLRAKKKIATPECSSLLNDSTFGLVEEHPPRPQSETQAPGLRRRSWFGGLAKRSAEVKTQEKRQESMAQRAQSMPPEVGKCGAGSGDGCDGMHHHQLGQTDHSKTAASLCRSDPVEEFWNDYWSINEESLKSELTTAERISQSSNKREAARTARTTNTFAANPLQRSSVWKMKAVNVFLDDLIDQCLDKPSKTAVAAADKKPQARSERLTEAAIEQTTTTTPAVKSDGDVAAEETSSAMHVRSNINELLYSSASGPDDRILEKWFLADKKAEADYHRNLSWIKTPVEAFPTGAGTIRA